MKYRKLTIENFGPYYGTHEVSFDRDQGVWIVYGDNGRGKTTLLNAFRYALYGKILGRRAERSPHEVANTRHTAESRQREFKTLIEFDHDSSAYRLTRHFRASHSPEHTLVVERDGTPLSDHDARKVMLAVAPESISQFFLFDGELLRQYEDLRDPNVDSGKRMRGEVDRLLGVHAVKNTLHDLNAISAVVNKEKARQLAADTQAKHLATALQEASDKRDALVTSLTGLRETLNQRRQRFAEIEDVLSRHERARVVLADIDALKTTKTNLELKRERALRGLRELTAEAWKAALYPAVSARLDELRDEIQRVDQQRIEAIVAHRTVQELEVSETCPVCSTHLDAENRDRVLDAAKRGPASEDVHRLDQLVSELRSQAEILEGLNDPSPAALLAEREKAVRSIDLEISETLNDITELEEGLKAIDEAEVRRHQRERDELNLLINSIEQDIETTRGSIQQQDNAIERIKGELARLNVMADPVLELRDRVVTDLLGLFNDALIQYQDKLLTTVEDEASKLFMAIRSEKEYVRLQIREGYGLTIVDETGEEVSGHSAGYEHLVALSLIAALQRSSPVQGPIVMDSPFGRLDDVHTRNVVAALPQIADQVVLLAFEGEFDRESALGALGDDLVGEFVLERVTSRHTRIAPGAPS